MTIARWSRLYRQLGYTLKLLSIHDLQEGRCAGQLPGLGSRHLTPERGMRTDMPDITFERSVCTQCGWAGEPIALDPLPEPQAPEEPKGPPDDECYLPGTPLRSIRKPTDNL